MTIRFKSLDQLDQFLDVAALPAGPAEPAPEPSDQRTAEPDALPDLQSLLAEIAAAGSALSDAAAQDAAARATAAQLLDQHDAALAVLHDAEQGHAQARTVREQAEQLLGAAFTEDARVAAAHIVERATQAEQWALALMETRRQEVSTLAERPEIQRLLNERRADAERLAEQQRAAEAEQARRLSDGLAQARAALRAGLFEEAQALVGPLAKEHPTCADVASLQTMILLQEQSVKNDAAATALRSARRIRRTDPAEAARLLEAVDVDGLPDLLARQVFGEWAQCNARRLAERGEEAAPLRYAPDPGRGLVLARESTGAYVVVSVLGMGPRWQPGQVVADRALLRRARPLR